MSNNPKKKPKPLLRPAFLNINRKFADKFEEIKHIIWKYNLGIIGLCETNLTKDQSIPPIAGYSSYSSDKYRLIVYYKDDLNLIVDTSFQTRTPSITLQGRDTTITVLYSQFKELVNGKWVELKERRLDHLEESLMRINQHSCKKSIILGDFNADLMSKDKEAKELDLQMSTYGYEQMVTGYTREGWRNQKSSLIDHIWVRNISGHAFNYDFQRSDHSIIFLSHDKDPCENVKTYEKRMVWEFTKESLHLARTTDHGLSMDNDFEDNIQLANKWLDKIDAPNHQEKTFKSGGQGWHNRICDKYLILMQKSTGLKRKEYRGIYTKVCRAEQRRYKETLKKRKGHPWPRKEKSTINSVFKNGTKEEVFDHEKISNEFMDTFRNKVEKNKKPNADFSKIKSILKERFKHLQEWEIPEPTLQDILDIIDELPPKRSTGANNKSYLLIKNIKYEVAPILQILITQSIRLGKVSTDWEEVLFVPVHKKSDKKVTSNYRPVGMQKILSRVTEKYVCKVFVKILEEKEIFHDNLHGFRPGRNPETAVIAITKKIEERKKKRKLVCGLALDCTSAFDLILPEVIMDSLECIKASPKTIQWFKSYMAGKFMRVKIKDAKSKKWVPGIGCIQGSTLSAPLFCLVTVAMDLVIDEEVVSYADDSLVIVEADNEKELMDKVEKTVLQVTEFFDSSGLTLQPSKSELIYFTHDGPEIMVAGHKVIPKDSITFLGLELSKNLKWDKHVEKLVKKINASVWTMRLNGKLLPIRDKICLYYGYSHSLLMNGIGAFVPFISKNQVRILQTALNRCLRFVFNITGKMRISMTKLRAAYNIPGVDLLKHETIERLACEHKDITIEKYSSVENYTGRVLRNRRVSNWWTKDDIESLMLQKVKRKPILFQIEQKKTLKSVQKMFRKLTFNKILGMCSKDYESFVISRVELFVLNEPTRSRHCTRARSIFPPLSQHLTVKYEQLCESQLLLEIESQENTLGSFDITRFSQDVSSGNAQNL